MNDTLLEYKCPNCGGNIKFNAATQDLQCRSCDTVFTEEELDNAQTQSYSWRQDGEAVPLEGMNGYSCQSCGAQIVADPTTAAAACPYCDSPVIMTGQVTGMNRPDCLIPFKLDREAAIAALKQFYKGKYFLPRCFTDQNRLKEIKGVYVPFWLFDCDVNASFLFDATRIKHWSDSKYNYVETTKYIVGRSGSIAFSRVPVDGSEKMDDAYMDGLEPFHYADLTEFNTGYLSGFFADKYDVSAADSFSRAETRVTNSTADAFSSTVQGYASVTPRSSAIHAGKGAYRYAMLPVWMMSTKYKDKLYTFAVNGQTGRVSGTLPTDRRKFWLTFAAIAAVCFAVGQFFVL